MRALIKITVILAIVIMPLMTVTWAFATAEPTSDPTISNLNANVYLRASGDVLIYGEYLIPYATIPDETADQSYVFRLLDIDGETHLGAVSPYVRFDSGYNEGAFSFYFSAADNLTVDQGYTIRISQSPAFFTTPQSWDYVLPLSAWTSYATQEENQTELTLNIISTAQRLEVAHDTTLLESSAGGTVLSDPAGENYFRGVIYGVQTMAPDLFLVQVYSFETGDRDYSTTQFDTYDERFDTTWLETTTANTSDTFGITRQTLMGTIFGLPIILGAVIISGIKFKRMEPGYMVAALVLIMLVLMGWFSVPLFATLYQLMAIYIGYLWFYARS